MVEVGETTSVAVVPPLLHVYVPPPVAVNVTGKPIHDEVLPLTFAVGGGTTVTEYVVLLVQPLASVPTTEYVCEVVGLTVIAAEVAVVLHT